MLDPIRFSNLKQVARSPLHYKHAVEKGRRDKPWLRGGRGLHCVLFNQPYVVFDGASRRGKAWDAFVANVDLLKDAEPQIDHEVILASELDGYKRMAEAIDNELTRQGLSKLLDGAVEEPIHWEYLGRKCRSTPDVLRRISIVDVKTTCNADPRRFHWDARKFCYAEQLRFYELAAQHRDDAGDPFTRELFIVAVEKEEPYPVVIWHVTDKMREQADRTIRLWFEQVLACEASDVWPGYVQCVQELDVLESDGVTLTIGGEDVDVE